MQRKISALTLWLFFQFLCLESLKLNTQHAEILQYKKWSFHVYHTLQKPKTRKDLRVSSGFGRWTCMSNKRASTENRFVEVSKTCAAPKLHNQVVQQPAWKTKWSSEPWGRQRLRTLPCLKLYSVNLLNWTGCSCSTDRKSIPDSPLS